MGKEENIVTGDVRLPVALFVEFQKKLQYDGRPAGAERDRVVHARG